MRKFRYVSMNNEGEIVKGQWECNNIKELIEYLHEKKSLCFYR